MCGQRPPTLRDSLLEAEQLRSPVEIAMADGGTVVGIVADVGVDFASVIDDGRRHDLALFHITTVRW